MINFFIFKDLFFKLVKHYFKSKFKYSNNYNNNNKYNNNNIKETLEIIHLLDSTSISLKEDWCKNNGRINGLKTHVEFNLNEKIPVNFIITDSTINDITVAKNDIEILSNLIYIFDKGYTDFKWWNNIHKNNSVFITRIKYSSINTLKTIKTLYNRPSAKLSV